LGDCAFAPCAPLPLGGKLPLDLGVYSKVHPAVEAH